MNASKGTAGIIWNEVVGIFDVNNFVSSLPEFLEAPSILPAVLSSLLRFQMSIFKYE
jgi:hypothetical protein